MSPVASASVPFVPETHLGLWFLGTTVSRFHVLGIALDDHQHMAPDLLHP